MKTMTRIRLPEAAPRLGLRTKDIYQLVEAGRLRLVSGDAGWPDVDEAAIDELARLQVAEASAGGAARRTT